jgi:hypothetical protein
MKKDGYGAINDGDDDDSSEVIYEVYKLFKPFYISYNSVDPKELLKKDENANVEIKKTFKIFCFKYKKTHESANDVSLKQVKSTLKYTQSHYKYAMFEDVHQVANYLELK